MATITPTPIGSDFSKALFNFLKTPGVEGFEPFVYDDSQGIPTLGVGYALVVNVGGVWKIRNDPTDITNYLTQFANNGIKLTDAQLKTLKDQLQLAADDLNAAGPVATTDSFPGWYPGLPDSANFLGWTITDEQALSLFKAVLPKYLSTVKTWLGNDTLYTSLQGSQEMMVLTSLAYNGYFGAGKSPALHKAIVDDGNRAEAWYEIRYNTPATNIIRNYAQAALFGLYDPGVVTEPEAIQVYQMFGSSGKSYGEMR